FPPCASTGASGADFRFIANKRGAAWLPFFLLLCRSRSERFLVGFASDSHRESGVLSCSSARSPVESSSPPELHELTDSFYSRAPQDASEDLGKSFVFHRCVVNRRNLRESTCSSEGCDGKLLDKKSFAQLIAAHKGAHGAIAREHVLDLTILIGLL